jgi:hypothetical protein
MTIARISTNDLETRLATLLNDIIDELEFADPEPAIAELAAEVAGIDRISTFDEAGVLTTDSGLVLSMSDGTEFQITIVRSK